jgi:putative membrane protein
VLAFLFLVFVSMTFVAILHALAARLGAVGKFLGLVLMVVQLVSAGGTFPWQTLPGPLQAIHHVVPMTYAIDGLRRLMYGADLGPVPASVAVLAAYLVGALAVSTVAARRSRMWTPSRIKPELSL